MGLAMQEVRLGEVLALGFGEGFVGSVASQALLNEEGEIDWEKAIEDGVFSAVTAGIGWGIGDTGKPLEGGTGTGTVWDNIKC